MGYVGREWKGKERKEGHWDKGGGFVFLELELEKINMGAVCVCGEEKRKRKTKNEKLCGRSLAARGIPK